METKEKFFDSVSTADSMEQETSLHTNLDGNDIANCVEGKAPALKGTRTRLSPTEAAQRHVEVLKNRIAKKRTELKELEEVKLPEAEQKAVVLKMREVFSDEQALGEMKALFDKAGLSFDGVKEYLVAKLM